MYQAYTDNTNFYPITPQMDNDYADEYRMPPNNYWHYHQRPQHFHGFHGMYPMPFYFNNPFFHMGYMNQFYNPYNWGHHYRQENMPSPMNQQLELKDYGPMPLIINIEESAERNTNFRLVLWTGTHLQVTLMSLNPGEDIGTEVHPNVDQFIRVEEGQGISQMGSSKNNLTLQRNLEDGSAIMVPAGTWHNITNTGVKPLKLYSIYAPPNHPKGTIHKTKADAEASEMNLG